MRQLIYFMTFLLYSTLLSCTVLKNNQNNQLIFELETTSCYGTCPVYKLHIYSDGFVKLEGKEHLDKIGIFKSSLSSEQLNTLQELFEKASFFDLKNSYTSSFTDLPTKYITYHKGDITKQIMAYDNIPKSLQSVIKKMEELIEELEWEKVK